MYSGGCIYNIAEYNNFSLDYSASTGVSLPDTAETVSPPSLSIWWILLIAFGVAAVIFLIRLLRHKFTKYDGVFNDLEEGYKKHIATNKLMKEIDNIYRCKKKVDGLFENGGIFKRKAWLLDELNEGKKNRECKVIFLSTALTALLTVFLEGNFFGFEIIKLGSIAQNVVTLVLVVLMAVSGTLLLNAFLYDLEDEYGQTRKYELDYIDKLLERRVNEKLSSLLETKDDDKKKGKKNRKKKRK